MSPLQAAWDRYFHGEIAPVRLELLFRSVLTLLAVDCWLLMVEHGGRYGVGGFNVAHFGWLDALQPVPTPSLYIAVVFAAGLLAMIAALSPIRWWLTATIGVLYSYGWAMSMLDSYQHHYLLSLILLCFVFWPSRSDSEKSGRAWPYGMLCVSLAIVYAYTAVSKSEAEWRSGDALRRIAPVKLVPIQRWCADLGIGESTFWSFTALSVIAVQVVVWFGYLAAPLRDRADDSKWRWAYLVPALAALSFHAGAEFLGLEIGAFSYYMMLVASIAFAPSGLLGLADVGLSRIRARVATLSADVGRGMALALALTAILVMIYFGRAVDLPGSYPAAILAGIVIGIATFVATLHRHMSHAVALGVGGLISGVAMWAFVTHSSVRFDYYRFVGGDLKRRGELASSLEAYIRANEYAPEGMDRRDKENEVRRLLGRETR